MMDCKKALAACENDVSKATDYLRKKGLASADKKSGRVASEGLIGSYIHDGRIGVLVEVNSETDFVARSAQFKELVANIGMQVAACPQVSPAGFHPVGNRMFYVVGFLIGDSGECPGLVVGSGWSCVETRCFVWFGKPCPFWVAWF